MTGSDSLLAIQLDSFERAEQLAVTAWRLHVDGHFALKDAVLVSHDDRGRVTVTETTDPTTPEMIAGGTMLGTLVGALLGAPVAGLVGAGLGALAAQLIDYGVKDEFVEQMRDQIQDDKTVLVLLVGDYSPETAELIADRLGPFRGAESLETDLPKRAADVVRSALET